jgi:hypothetical protein
MVEPETIRTPNTIRTRHHLRAANTLGLTVPLTLVRDHRRGDRIARRGFEKLLAAISGLRRLTRRSRNAQGHRQ